MFKIEGSKDGWISCWPSPFTFLPLWQEILREVERHGWFTHTKWVGMAPVGSRCLFAMLHGKPATKSNFDQYFWRPLQISVREIWISVPQHIFKVATKNNPSFSFFSSVFLKDLEAKQADGSRGLEWEGVPSSGGSFVDGSFIEM